MTTKAEKMTVFALRIPKDMRDQLYKLRKKEERPINYLVLKACEKYWNLSRPGIYDDDDAK